MNNQLTASVNLFNPDSRVIFFFEERIGEITEKAAGYFLAETIHNKQATFTDYNTACSFLQRSYEHIERKRKTKTLPGQSVMLF